MAWRKIKAINLSLSLELFYKYMESNKFIMVFWGFGEISGHFFFFWNKLQITYVKILGQSTTSRSPITLEKGVGISQIHGQLQGSGIIATWKTSLQGEQEEGHNSQKVFWTKIKYIKTYQTIRTITDIITLSFVNLKFMIFIICKYIL